MGGMLPTGSGTSKHSPSDDASVAATDPWPMGSRSSVRDYDRNKLRKDAEAARHAEN